MASADYSVGTKVTADVSNFEKGMNKAEKALKGFSDKLANSIDRLGKKGLIGSVANVTLAMQGLTKSFNTVIKFAKDVGNAINECTEAYKGQVIAERALDTAIQNNPFISGESSKALKQFASDMQRVSNYGDEELIPMMTNLVSLGRTEAETMQIMSVAMDMSAGMGISLDTAITQLNATLNGNIGRLGQQNSELKDLTEEELKQGKAIEILGEKFKGLSSATADTSKQLQNIKGDFKEALGQFTLPSSDMWNKFWAGFYERGIEVIGKINAYIDAQTIGRKLASEYVKQIKAISTEKVYNPETGIYDVRDLGARVKYIREALKVLSDEELKALNNYLSSQRRLNDEEQQLLNRIKAEQDSRYQGSVNAKKEAEDKKKQADAEAQITAELQKQEEIAKKKTDWSSKLLDQRIEMLETERDRAMQYAEEEGEETYTIWRDYNEKILELKLEQLEKAKKAELEAEGVSAEDKIAIEEYYKKESEKIYTELGVFKSKKLKEESDALSESLAKINNVFVKKMMEIWKKFTDFINKDNDFYKSLVDKINAVKDKIKEQIKDIMKRLYDNTVGKLIELIPDSVKKVLSNIGGVLKGVIKQLVKFFAPIIKFCGEVVTTIGKLFIAGVKAYVKMIQTAINTIYKILKSAFDIFKKLIDFNISDALDVLLKFEDSVLTFFVETLPKLPQFVSTVLKSINTMLSTLINSVKAENIATVIYGIINELAENLPSLVQNLITMIQGIISFSNENLSDIIYQFLNVIEENAVPLIYNLLDMIESVVINAIDGIVKWLDEGGLKTLLNMAIKIQTTVQNIFMKLLTSVAGLMENHTGDVTEFLSESLQKAMKDLPELVDSLLRIINSLIKSVADLFKDKKFMDSFVKSINDTFNALMDRLPDIIGSVVDLILNLITELVPRLPEIILNIIGKIVETIPKIINQIVERIGGSISDIFSRIFTAEFWQNVFGKIGEGFQKIFESLGKGLEEAFTKGGYGKNSTGSTVGDLAVDFLVPFGFLRHFFADGTNNAPSGLAVVGEAGPELVKFRGGEQVLNNRNTNKALANMGGTTINQNVTFNNLQDTSAYAMMNQLKQYNRQMAINGVI